MASTEEAEKVTGYLVGGISPFGTKKALPVWFHESIPVLERIGINAGRRGCILFLNPADAVTVLKAQVCDLAM